MALPTDVDKFWNRHGLLLEAGVQLLLHLCPSARPGVARARAAAGEGDHPPVRAARKGRLAARSAKDGDTRPPAARAALPLRARGAAPPSDDRRQAKKQGA